ncbi:exosortase K [Aureivirga marina]|uniref:exosortase K n=1 Tax=Aureivirga marina TaxID=1182451 RepID=UPI0018C9FBD9|nr:exosortase K [Aureivirga marina]
MKEIVLTKNYIFYGIAIFLLFLLKFWYKNTSADDVGFLLKPVDEFISLITNSNSIFTKETGYFHKKLNIYIDKSCSGFNLWIIATMLFIFQFVTFLKKDLNKILAIIFSFFIGYIFTIIVNTFRIYTAIIFKNISIFEANSKFTHEFIGAIINLTFLILAYTFIQKIINKNNYEKFASSKMEFNN